MPRLPQSWLVPIAVTREASPQRAALCFAATEWSSLWAGRGEFLHPQEEEQLSRAGVPKRQAEFLRGRYCAKEALGALAMGGEVREAWVASGVFGQPVVRGTPWPNVQVSIAHSESWAAALAFDEAHPMAIDVEVHDERHGETLRREASAPELAALLQAGLAEPLALTLLWAAKESLAKVLRTGLMTPLALYAVQSAERAEDGSVVCHYHHFAQYKSHCRMRGNLAVAIALPRKSDLQLQWPTMTVAPR